MCGFVGLFHPEGLSDAQLKRLANARDLMTHRGPDDAGLWVSPDRRCALAHRRLAILDLSPAGHQPMTRRGDTWLAYNGETYNFRELRELLGDQDNDFHSDSDTEVLLAAYHAWGADMLTRLRGMFAFALYDVARGQLLLARDRVGIKPLYTARSGGALIFASEIKALFALGDLRPALNGAALNEYLAFGQVYGPHTLFTGVSRFPAGHRACYHDTIETAPQAYWSPWQQPADLPDVHDVAGHSNRLRSLLKESVALRMRSDVPVGVFLSGGVDSTANVALMSRLTKDKVRTFTVGFENQADYDERAYARQAASLFKTDHHELEVGRHELARMLPEICDAMEEPIADPTVVPIYALSRFAKAQGVTVVLNGDGADELFCGYRRWTRYLRLHHHWRKLSKLPKRLLRIGARLGTLSHGDARAVDLVRRAALELPMYIGATGPIKGMPVFERILRDGEGDVYRAVREGWDAFLTQRKPDDLRAWLTYWGLRSEVENVFLYRADRLGMAHSLEIRVPFLDHPIVEYAHAMPQRWKVVDGEPKYILKRCLAPLIKKTLLYRPKMGFCVPIQPWAGDMMHDAIRQGLPRLAEAWPALSKDVAKSLINRATDGDPDGFLTWQLYALVTWYQHWFD